MATLDSDIGRFSLEEAMFLSQLLLEVLAGRGIEDIDAFLNVAGAITVRFPLKSHVVNMLDLNPQTLYSYTNTAPVKSSALNCDTLTSDFEAISKRYGVLFRSYVAEKVLQVVHRTILPANGTKI